MIVCQCRGKSAADIARVIDAGAETLRDLQRCGIGDQCGSCHVSLRAMLTQAHAAAHARGVQQPSAIANVAAPAPVV